MCKYFFKQNKILYKNKGVRGAAEEREREREREFLVYVAAVKQYEGAEVQCDL